MSVTVRLSEERGRPEDATLELRQGEPLLIYLLPPRANLRRTLLRVGNPEKLSETPPLPGCQYLLRIAAEGHGGSLRDIGLGVLVERPGEARDERLEQKAVLRSGDRLRVTTGDTELYLRLTFDLREQARVEQAVGAWRTREEGPTFDLAREVWALPSAWEGLSDPMRGLQRGARRLGARLGLGPAALGLLAGALGLLVAAGVGLWAQARAVDAAEARARAAEAGQVSADQARQAASGSEAVCLEDRTRLAGELGDQKEAARAALSAWLGLGAARAQALRIGGPRLAEVPDRGEALVDDLLAMDPPMAPAGEEAKACLEYTAELGPDLPNYVLAWHPTHKLVCPEGYDETVDGVHWKGRWGLSDRVVAVLGDGGEGDPRDSDPRAAAMLGRGVREVLNAILTTPTERPPVIPSQAQLWALELFEAYNRLPMEPEGVRMAGPGECVRGWLEVANQKGDWPLTTMFRDYSEKGKIMPVGYWTSCTQLTP